MSSRKTTQIDLIELPSGVVHAADFILRIRDSPTIAKTACEEWFSWGRWSVAYGSPSRVTCSVCKDSLTKEAHANQS